MTKSCCQESFLNAKFKIQFEKNSFSTEPVSVKQNLSKLISLQQISSLYRLNFKPVNSNKCLLGRYQKTLVTFIGPTHRPSDAHVCFLFLYILKEPGHADWESFFLLQRKPKVRKRLWVGKPSFNCGRPTFTRSQSPQRGKWHKIWKPGLKRSTQSGLRWAQK